METVQQQWERLERVRMNLKDARDAMLLCVVEAPREVGSIIRDLLRYEVHGIINKIGVLHSLRMEQDDGDGEMVTIDHDTKQMEKPRPEDMHIGTGEGHEEGSNINVEGEEHGRPATQDPDTERQRHEGKD